MRTSHVKFANDTREVFKSYFTGNEIPLPKSSRGGLVSYEGFYCSGIGDYFFMPL